ncbi:MAG: YDG domain-containing protein [Verrucomicrobiota bacterium]
MRIRHAGLLALGLAALGTIPTALGQAPLLVYTDQLVNGFQNWSWATVNLAASSPVHSGTASISVVNGGSYQALYLQHANFSTRIYTNLSFWINGGSGGQSPTVHGLVNGTSVSSYSIGPLPANTWVQYTIPLSTLSIANVSNCSGIWIQGNSASAQPAFYVDDIQFGAAPPPAAVHLALNAANTVRKSDSRWFGLNTAIWDTSFDTASTSNALRDIGTGILRFPGGSLSDEYHWATGKSGTNSWAWGTSFGNFMHILTNGGMQAMITVNYGTGTSNEAAAWVLSANVTNKIKCKYWEIGNECYGTWETDSNSVPHDPYTYAVRARDYINAMKAADPTIKIGVVAVPGEDSSVNNNNHAVVNPRTGVTHYGWTPVMLATLKNLGVTPDFLVHHVYPEYTGGESDPLLLGSTGNWAVDAADLRQQLSDYLGTVHTNVELLCTENNSNSGNQGKQSTSVVNALYLADSLSQLMKTEFNGYVWWDLRNGSDTSGTFNSSIYGWRSVGDLGIMVGTGTHYPTYYADKLMRAFVGTNDTILNPTSDYPILSTYASLKADGSLAMLVINKDTVSNFTGQVALSGFNPAANATVKSWGILQDEMTRTNGVEADVATTNLTGVSSSFNYSFPAGTMTLLIFTPSGLVQTPATVVVSSAANPSTYGNAVTYTATVRTNGVALTTVNGESVSFYNNGTLLGSGTLNGSGQASYTTATMFYTVGSASITAVYPGDVLYTAATNSPAYTQTINPATVTAGLVGTISRRYDGTANATIASGNYSLGGVIAGDTVTLNNPSSGTYDNRNVGTTKIITVTGLAISGSSASNYALASTTITKNNGTITKTNITVTAAPNTKGYDGNLTAAATPAITAGSIQTGDSASFSEAYASKTVGTGKTLVPAGTISDGNSGGNYNLTFANNLTGVITSRTLTVTATGVNKNYDGTTAATVTLSDNRVAGDSLTTSYTTATFSNRNAGAGKSVSVSGIAISGTDAGNYTQNTTASTTADIAALPLTVTATADSRLYDGTSASSATPAITSGSVQTGDTAAFTQSFDNPTAGTGKTLTASGIVNDGNSGNNYTYIFAPNTSGTINPLPAVLTGTRIYDSTTTADASILSVANVVGTDDVTVASGSATLAAAGVGTQPIASFDSLALGGVTAPNYTLTGASGSVTITSATVSVNVTNLLALDKVYDGSTNATLDATSAGLDGIANGDDVTLVTSNAVAYFLDKNVGTNKPVTVVGVELTGAAASNYTAIDPTNLTASITPAPLSVSGISAANKVYDGTTNAALAGNAELSGTIGSDDVALVTNAATASFADPAVGTAKPVAVAGFSLSGADAVNYLLTQPAGLSADILALVTPTLAPDAVVKTGAGYQVTFTAQAGQTYKVLVSSDLSVPLSQWTVLTNGTCAVANTTILDTTTNLPARFYRVVSPQ